ncbi:two-component regulator propeller domain-containing protein [Larkinella soli]|uniref:two-component regulator propeller domain-containing protein n=1 Tax=Larkinella soli TaxID=1770527 RepID=UPI000FFB99A2|nr:two-component regulator propeller domain-containing protein [Larkinella soli]
MKFRPGPLLYGLGFLLLWALEARGQSAGTFTHLSVKDGLAQNAVNYAFQDQEGFLWFATSDGLSKYDGYQFTNFLSDPLRRNGSLYSSHITYIHEDRSNRLWICTNAGLHEIDKKTHAIRSFRIKGDGMNNWNKHFSICEDHEGKLWLGARGGLCRFEPNRKVPHFTLYPFPFKDRPLINVVEDRQHRLWVSSTEGLFLFDRQKPRFIQIPFPRNPDKKKKVWCTALYIDKDDVLWVGTVGKHLLQVDLNAPKPCLEPYQPRGRINENIFVNAIREDSEGYLWIGTTKGLQRLDKKTGDVLTFSFDPSMRNGIGSMEVRSIFQDRSSTFWISTENGVDKLDLRPSKFTTVQITPSPAAFRKKENHIGALLEEKTGRLWISNFGGLYQLDPDSSKPVRIPIDPFVQKEVRDEIAMALQQDTLGRLWVGGFNGFYYQNPETDRFINLPSKIRILFLSKGTRGEFWVGGEGGFARFNPYTRSFQYFYRKPLQPSDRAEKNINAILATRDGQVWVCYNGKGIYRFDPNTRQMIRYKAAESSPVGQLNGEDIVCIHEDRKGLLWFGTSFGGLCRLDPKTGVFKRITSRNGLPGNRVTAIVGDESGHLWISTNRGICRYNERMGTFRVYQLLDGLPDHEFIRNSAGYRNGRVIFGGVNGLISFRPDDIRNNLTPPPVHVTAMKVWGKNQPLTGEPLSFSHTDNSISFEFIALNYDDAEKSQYAFRLSGVDKGWVHSGTRRFAGYTNLEPGDYQFQVKASNSDGTWNEQGRTVRFAILPPWWATWWAYLLYVSGAFAGIRGIIQYRNRTLLKEKKLLEKQVAERTAEVVNQKEEIETQRDHLEEMLTKLQTTQDQLIQKEKMASLGELTAGIAHEIKNPLNFVNNFSEVSIELIDELENLPGPDPDAENDILAYLKDNLRKILAHGRRADAIVRGMLEHSRASTGEPEPTDINNLADEFLRLAYQGQRSKDAGFQAELTTSFDRDIGKIEVVPQDIGRVLLNLYSNAFYALHEKQQLLGSRYTGHLWVSTQRRNGELEIRVRDNGTGIPDAVREKIFQPFFTTKPAGEGTGLGLSLSYEIITKGHGGTLEARNLGGEGSEFVVRIPVKAEKMINSASL